MVGGAKKPVIVSLMNSNVFGGIVVVAGALDSGNRATLGIELDWQGGFLLLYSRVRVFELNESNCLLEFFTILLCEPCHDRTAF